MTQSATTLTTETATPAGGGKLARTIGYYAAFIVIGMAAAALGPTLPGLARHTQTQLSEISFLFTALSLGYLLGSFQGGRLYDRVEGHTMLAVALIVMAVTLALMPLISLLWLLAAVVLTMGVAQSVVDVGGNTLLVWMYGDEVGPFMNGLHFFFGAGAFLSPIIIAQVVLIRGDITWAYWALALLVLPVIVLVLRLPGPASQASAQDSPVGNVNQPATAYPRMSKVQRHVLIALIASFFFLYVGAEISFGGWIFTYALALNLSSETTAAYLTSAFWGSFTLGRLLSIPIAARFRPRLIMLGSLVGCLVSLGLMLLWSNSLAAVWLGALGVGLSMAAIFPTTISLASRRMTITGQATGLFFVGASAGGMFLPWLIGQLFESVGPRVTMLAILADMTVAMAVFAGLIIYSTRPAMNEIRP